jgi:Carboxypeptidase regulatory-like domain/TonB-dependent Receptor Plug Domain
MRAIEKSYRSLSAVFLCLLFVSGIHSVAVAQSAITVSGTLTDPTGAAISGAVVTATNLQTGIKTSSRSGGDGHYVILGLSAGFYDFEASSPGFATSVRHHEELFVGATVTFDFPLQVSGVQQEVEVSTVSTLLQPTQSLVANVLQTTQLDNLPIVGRTFSDLASLAPGVQVTTVGTPTVLTSNISIGNGPTYETGFVVDGIPVTRPADSGLYVTYAQDWIQEFSVLTNQFNAEYGGAASGIVNSITRSGSNQLHGRAYGFFQDSIFNSNPAFLAAGASKAQQNLQRVGGMVGGPLIKNKLFYFMGYEYYRTESNVVVNPIPVAFQTAPYPFTLPQFYAGGAIPTLNRTDLAMMKIDYQLNPKDSFSLAGNIQVNGNPVNATGGAVSIGASTVGRGSNYAYSATWRRLISQSALNELRYYGARTVTDTTCLYRNAIGSYVAPAGTTPSPYTGITSAGNPVGLYANLSYPGAAGDPALQVGCPTGYGGPNFIGIYAGFYETLTITRGNHVIKLGGAATDPFAGARELENDTDGAYGFSSTQTIPFNPTSSATFPNSYTVAYGTPAQSYRNADGWAIAIFIQDAWKINPNLTLNPGLRYDPDFANSNFKKYIPAGANPIDNDLAVLAPRLGFAWTPLKSKQTVFRGGFGIFYDQNFTPERTAYAAKRSILTVADQFTANSVSLNPYCINNSACATSVPANLQTALKAVLAYALINTTLPNLNPAGGAVTVGGTSYAVPGFTGTIPQGGDYNIDQNIRIPGTLQATGGFQHSFNRGLLVAADYSYKHGFDQIEQRNVNINPNTLPAVQLLNPNYTSFISYGNGGYYTSKSLLVNANYRDHRNDLLTGAYTLAWARDDSSTTQDFNIHSAGISTDPFDYSVDDGPSLNDQRQHIVVSAVLNTKWGIYVDPIINYSTALPYTATTTSTTVAGCQPWYNQCYPAGYSKDSLRGRDTFTINTRIQKVFHLGKEKSITGLFEGYNVTNRTNIGTAFVTNVSSATFGQPTGTAGPKRVLQLGGRFDF